MLRERLQETRSGDDSDPIPVFGTWGRIYAGVIVWAVIVMGLIALFSAARY